MNYDVSQLKYSFAAATTTTTTTIAADLFIY